jgi:hypothetical protein
VSTVDPKFEARARRENARRTAQAPLLAASGLVPLTTPKEMAERKARIHGEAVASREAMDTAIEQTIAERLALLGPHKDEVLERLTAIYPRGLWPDILGGCLRRMAKGLDPLEPQQRPMTRDEIQAGQERVLALKARWAKIDAAHPDVCERARNQDKEAIRELVKLRACGEQEPMTRVVVTIGGAVHDLIAERPVMVPDTKCPGCLRPLGVGIGLGNYPIYQAHCHECLHLVGTLEIMGEDKNGAKP